MMKRITTLAITMMTTMVMFSLSAASRPSILSRQSRADAERWVDSVYNTMTERQRIAQLFIPRLDISDNANSRALLKRLVVNEGIGGILLGKGDIKMYHNLIDYAQSLTRVPLFITLDGEWGLSMRMKDAPRFPHNMGLGAIADDSLLYAYGRETARQCHALGININFAPVLDVNSNPSNPVIGYRSFGEDPARVARLGVAYSRGLEDGGVLSVAKHFPGHGDTSVDSHKALPTVNHDRATLEKTDLLPFRHYIDAGLSSVMVGHLNVPAIDKSGLPASLSHAVSTGLLRDKMKFKGLVFTDALAMKGAHSTAGNNCVLALEAGADVLLGTTNTIHDIDAVEAAVKAGKITRADIERGVKEILRYKYALGLSEPVKTASNPSAVINSREADGMIRRLAAASVTVVYNKENLLPLKDIGNKRIAVVSIGAPADNRFSQYCAKYASVTKIGAPAGTLTATEISRLKEYDIVIAGVFNDTQGARTGLASLNSIRNVIPVFFINPYKMAKFATSISHHSTLVTAYDDIPATREYAAQALFGGIKVNGRLPVNLKGIAPMGSGMSLPKTRLGYSTTAASILPAGLDQRVDSLIKRGISTGAFPGCQVLIAKGGDVIIGRSYGKLSTSPKASRVDGETLYDLASVSKTIGTLPGLMKAYDLGMYSLDDSVSQYIAGLKDTDKGDITVRQMLFHESGMPPSLNMYELLMDSTTYEGKIMSRKRDNTYSIRIEDGLYGNKDARMRRDLVRNEPNDTFDIKIAEGLWISPATTDTVYNAIYNAKLGNKKYRYSCLNFCLLMQMEENLTGQRHDRWDNDSIFAPLGAYRTFYRPEGKYPLAKIASTERDNYLRRQTMHGYVHDELADFIGGISGNAGVFATADDVAKVCQMWLNGGSYGGEQILTPETVKLFTETVSPTCNRGLGFDKLSLQSPGKTKVGAPTSTYGHTGFTGTCFWVDPDNDIIFIFLCNRVNPTRNNRAFTALNIRTALHSAIYDFL